MKNSFLPVFFVIAVMSLSGCQSDSKDSDSGDDFLDMLRGSSDFVSSSIIDEYGSGKNASGFGDLKAESAVSGTGTTYVVGNSGDKKDENGYFSSEILVDAIKRLVPGDTLVLKDGDYAGCLELKGLNGNSSNYITVKAENSRKAVLHGITSDSGKAVIKMKNCSYVNVDGLKLCDAIAKKSSKGIHITPSTHHVAITGCEFTNIRTTAPTDKGSAHGICIWGDDGDNSIHDVLVKNNKFHDMETGWSECITVTGNSEKINIIGNTLSDTGNIGIDVGGNYGYCPDPFMDFARFVYIAGNSFSGCVSPNAMADAIYLDGGQHIIIENNTIASGQSGISINSEQVVSRKECFPGDVVIRNNTIKNTTHRAFGCGVGSVERKAAVMHVLFTGNTCVDNGTRSSGVTALVFTICKDVKVVGNTFESTDYKKNGVYYKFHYSPDFDVLNQNVVISGNDWNNIKNPENAG